MAILIEHVIFWITFNGVHSIVPLLIHKYKSSLILSDDEILKSKIKLQKILIYTFFQWHELYISALTWEHFLQFFFDVNFIVLKFNMKLFLLLGAGKISWCEQSHKNPQEKSYIPFFIVYLIATKCPKSHKNVGRTHLDKVAITYIFNHGRYCIRTQTSWSPENKVKVATYYRHLHIVKQHLSEVNNDEITNILLRSGHWYPHTVDGKF